MEKRALGVTPNGVLDPGELVEVNAREVPPVRIRDGLDLLFGFGKGNVETDLVLFDPFQEELHCQSGLANARIAFHKVKAVLWQAAIQHRVKTGYSHGTAELIWSVD